VIHTRGYSALYLTSSLLCLGLVLWVLALRLCLSPNSCLDYSDSEGIVFASLTVIATAVLLAEVLVRLIGARAAYFRSAFNVIDLIALIAAVTALPTLFLVDWQPTTSLLAPICLFVRNFLQSIRLCLIIQRYGRWGRGGWWGPSRCLVRSSGQDSRQPPCEPRHCTAPAPDAQWGLCCGCRSGSVDGR
jgi:hypothetical protein